MTFPSHSPILLQPPSSDAANVSATNTPVTTTGTADTQLQLEPLMRALFTLENETRGVATHLSRITTDVIQTTADRSPSPVISSIQAAVAVHKRIVVNLPEYEYVLVQFPQLGVVERLTVGLLAYRAGQTPGTDVFVLTRASFASDEPLNDRFNLTITVTVQQHDDSDGEETAMVEESPLLPSFDELLRGLKSGDQHEISHIQETLSTLNSSIGTRLIYRTINIT